MFPLWPPEAACFNPATGVPLVLLLLCSMLEGRELLDVWARLESIVSAHRQVKEPLQRVSAGTGTYPTIVGN